MAGHNGIKCQSGIWAFLDFMKVLCYNFFTIRICKIKFIKTPE